MNCALYNRSKSLNLTTLGRADLPACSILLILTKYPNITSHSLLIVTFMPLSPGWQVRAGEVRGARRGAGRPPVAAVQPPVRPLRRHPHALQPPLVPGRPHRGLGCSLCPNYLFFL